MMNGNFVLFCTHVFAANILRFSRMGKQMSKQKEE